MKRYLDVSLVYSVWKMFTYNILEKLKYFGKLVISTRFPECLFCQKIKRGAGRTQEMAVYRKSIHVLVFFNSYITAAIKHYCQSNPMIAPMVPSSKFVRLMDRA